MIQPEIEPAPDKKKKDLIEKRLILNYLKKKKKKANAGRQRQVA